MIILVNPNIGIGHRVYDSKKYKGRTLTAKEVNTLFDDDVKAREPTIDVATNGMNLDQAQKDAAMDFHFNTNRVNKLDLSNKGGNAFLGWMQGSQVHGIWRRRIGEQMMYKWGKYIGFEKQYNRWRTTKEFKKFLKTTIKDNNIDADGGGTHIILPEVTVTAHKKKI